MGYIGNILGISGGYLGDILEISWRYLGGILGISWGYLGNILGTIGSFVHLSICPLVPYDYWTIDPWVHWSIGPLIHWSIGPNVNKVKLLSERTSGVPPVIFSSDRSSCTDDGLLLSDPSGADLTIAFSFSLFTALRIEIVFDH